MKTNEIIKATNKELVRLQKDLTAEICYRKRKIAEDYVIKNTPVIEIGNFIDIGSNEFLLKGTDALKQEHEITIYIAFEKNKCSIEKHVVLTTIPPECTYRNIFENDDE